MSQYLDQKPNFTPAINKLSEEIIDKIGKGNSIQSKVLSWYGRRGFEVKFSGNIIDGKFNENAEVTLFDPLGNQITDGNEINKYLHTLSNKIINEGLDKKKGLFSGLFNILGNAVNNIEDVSRILTKTFFNNLIVGLGSLAIDYFTGTKIYQNLEDKQYFSLSKETKGLARLVDPSYLVSNLAFKPARAALKFVDRAASLLFPLNSRSYYLPIINQSDIDKNEKQREKEKEEEREIEKAKEKEKEEERERKGSKNKLRRAGGMRRPDLTSAFTIRPTGMAPYDPRPINDYFKSTAYSSDDLSIEYDNPYIKNNPYNHNYTTTSLSQKGSSGPEIKLTPQQTGALFEEARLSWQKSVNNGESVTPPRNGVSFQRRFDPGSFRQSIKDQEGQEGQGR